MIWYVSDIMVAIVPLFDYLLWHIFALAFLCTVPILIRDLFRR